MKIAQKPDPVPIVQATACQFLRIPATLPSKPCHLKNTPTEILFHIVKNLSARNLCFLIRTSRYFASILTPELFQLALVQKNVSICLERYSSPLKIPLLCWAASMGNYPLACFLVQNGVDINAKDHLRGKTPLHHAARALESSDSNMRIMDLLLKSGADTEASDKKGNTPLHHASEHNIPTLLRGGANIEALNNKGRTPLHIAARSVNSHRIVELLLKGGANIGARSPRSQCTPLHEAILPKQCNEPSLEVVTLLLDRGANIEASSCDGYTPFFLAVIRWSSNTTFINLITLLLDRGASTNTSNKDGNTPLLVAASDPKKKDLVPMLLERGANIETRNKWQQTVLHLAAAVRELDLDLVNLLLDRGANIEAQDYAGNTVLHMIIETAKVETIRSLLVRGAWKSINVSSYIRRCETVLDKAIDSHVGSDIQSLLKEYGAKQSRERI